MRWFAVALILGGMAAANAASAQSPQPAPVRTCSGLQASCSQRCPPAYHRCSLNCDTLFGQCMQTGEWRGAKYQFSGVQRR